jgi:Protein of unknown function (DUF1360)
MGSHLALVVAYNGLVGAFLAARARAGKGFPERIGIGDLLLAGVATHKLSRVIAKDRVTAPLRAPFTEFEGEGGPGRSRRSHVGAACAGRSASCSSARSASASGSRPDCSPAWR